MLKLYFESLSSGVYTHIGHWGATFSICSHDLRVDQASDFGDDGIK